MNARFQDLVGWCHDHTLTVALILFVLSCLISIYSTEIKHFLHHWPRTRAGFVRLIRNKAENDLRLLNDVHNDVYQLVFYVIWAFVNPLVMGIYYTIGTYVVVLLLPKHQPISSKVIFAYIGGFVLGSLIEVRRTLKRLQDYDASVKTLQKRIQGW